MADCKIGDLVARLRGVDHLEEGDAVDLHHGVILGDHLLARHLNHLLHDIELAPDAIDERDNDAKPRPQGAGIAAEALDRVVPPLRHDFNARGDDGDEQNKQDQDEDIEAEHWPPPRCRTANVVSYRALAFLRQPIDGSEASGL